MFSVIIPTYNNISTLAYSLASILDNECISDIEVILSDDCSSENIQDLVDYYSKLMNIVLIRNDVHYGYPSVGRMNGLSKSTKEWVCFVDSDDILCSKALDKVKEFILKLNVHNVLYTKFASKRVVDGLIKVEEPDLEVTHGKFYERRFLKDYSIDYPLVQYNEDILFQNQVMCTLKENEIEERVLPLVTYIYQVHDGSLTRSDLNTADSYYYRSLSFYIECTLGVFVDRLGKCKKTSSILEFYQDKVLRTLLRFYFHMQGVIYSGEKDKLYISQIEEKISRYLKRYLEIREETLDYLLSLIKDSLSEYSELREICLSQIPFIESETILDWVSRLYRIN